MRMNWLRPALAGLALITTLPVQAVEDNFYNGVWYNENFGYIISKQNGDHLVGTLLLPNANYMAFFGSFERATDCIMSPCPPKPIIANLNQLFIDDQVTLKVDFGVPTATPPTQGTVTLTTCNTPNACLIPVGVSLTIDKIF
jgi:hypothetical protein